MSDDTTPTSPAGSEQAPAGSTARDDTAGASPRLRNFGLGFIVVSAVVVILAFVLENGMAG